MDIYQVTAKWHVFRIPLRYNDYYDILDDWLIENATGNYKIFYVESGSSKINNNVKKYEPLVEVDLMNDDDASLFKLTWCESDD